MKAKADEGSNPKSPQPGASLSAEERAQGVVAALNSDPRSVSREHGTTWCNISGHVAAAIRAAESARDAQWRKALELSHYDSIDGLHFECDECAQLRVLLASNASLLILPQRKQNEICKG